MKQLFEYIIISGVDFDEQKRKEKKKLTPNIKMLIPDLRDQVPENISIFCQPSEQVSIKEKPKDYVHQFVLSANPEEKIYGTCFVSYFECYRPPHHKSRSNSKNKEPEDPYFCAESICLVSKCPFHATFYELFQSFSSEIKGRITRSHAQRLYQSLLDDSGQIPLIFPGQKPILVRSGVFRIQFPQIHQDNDKLPFADIDYQILFHALSANNITYLIMAILNEKTIIMATHERFKLVPCCEALLSLIYPVEWMYPYIPNLPISLSENLESPTICFYGINPEMLRGRDLTPDSVIVDLDNDEVYCQLDVHLLPQRILNKIRGWILNKDPKTLEMDPLETEDENQRTESFEEDDIETEKKYETETQKIIHSLGNFQKISKKILLPKTEFENSDLTSSEDEELENIPSKKSRISKIPQKFHSELSRSHANPLRSNLLEIHSWDSLKFPTNKFGKKSNKTQDPIENLRNGMVSIFVSLLRNYMNFVSFTDRVKFSFKKKKFMEQVPEDCVPFLNHFLSTQIFCTFIETHVTTTRIGYFEYKIYKKTERLRKKITQQNEISDVLWKKDQDQNWTAQRFQLKDRKLSEFLVSPGIQEHQGTISIEPAMYVQIPVHKEKENQFNLVLSQDKILYLAADSRPQRNKWVSALKIAILDENQLDHLYEVGFNRFKFEQARTERKKIAENKTARCINSMAKYFHSIPQLHLPTVMDSFLNPDQDVFNLIQKENYLPQIN
ncbi:denn domain-containing protein [Anaeramoeba ignava]|uniref:Denn domain-containing protein n=1 Tax=Anaeramoeba ignava TaxID=1746090 RepID=A0A9Q0L7E0_ANAIG|nr:denn domain-containing protein [Anaeramoeba ignava]